MSIERLGDIQRRTGSDTAIPPAAGGPATGSRSSHMGSVSAVIEVAPAPKVDSGSDTALEVWMLGIDSGIHDGDSDTLAGNSHIPRQRGLDARRRTVQASMHRQVQPDSLHFRCRCQIRYLLRLGIPSRAPEETVVILRPGAIYKTPGRNQALPILDNDRNFVLIVNRAHGPNQRAGQLASHTC